MLSVKRISFTSESTNLLQNALAQRAVTSNSNPIPAITANKAAAENVSAQKTQPAADSFAAENKPAKKSFKNFIKEYGGVIALGISLIAVPLTFILTKKSYTKQMDKLQQSISELTKKLNDLLKTTAPQSPQTIAPKKVNLVTVLLGIGSALGINEYLKNNKDKLKEMGLSDDEINDAQKTAEKIVAAPDKARQAAANAADSVKGLESRIGSAEQVANDARSIARDAKSTVETMDGRINEARNRADEARGAALSGIRPEMQKFLRNYYDLWIMQYPEWEKRINNLRTDTAMSAVRNASIRRLDRSAKDTLADIKAYKTRYKKELTSTWALTAEFKPIKLGGLGDVPVDLQDNFTKLDIDNPVFLPMYETPGVSKFTGLSENTAKYKYKKNEFKLRKMADMTVDVFKDGKTESQPVEFYLSDKDGKQIIFVRNNSFKGSIYETTTQAEEPEKFAVFTKAVYQLAKTKISEALEEHPLSSYPSLTKYSAYDDVKAPNSMILNDWHAGTMAGLMRYRSAMEYNYNEVNDKVFDALSNMPLLMIGHNLHVQGSSNSGYGNSTNAKNNITQNVINTLYDKYAMGVVENAHSGLENEDICNTVLLKRTKEDKQFNSLFHGIALADWFVPVSKNYSNEIVNDVMQSGITQPLLARRKPTGTVEGIINGTDLVKHNMNAVSAKNFVEGLVLEKYDKNNDIAQIMDFRTENKRRFYHSFIRPMLDGELTEQEVVNPSIGRKDITEEEFVNAPLLSFAHRLTDQKGLALLKGAIFKLFDNWENEFGEKPMPFFLVGGPPESKQEVEHLETLKNPEYGANKARLDHVFALKGNMPNPAIMSVSTYFCAPSTFEPCGLTQGECFAKGTPVIATDTGGYHDTIEDGVTGFLAPEINEQSVYETIVKALHTYFDEPEKYQNMVKEDLNIDFSWARAGRKGPIYEYTDKLGFNRRRLPDIATAA